MLRFEFLSRKKATLLWALSFVFMIVAGMNKLVTLADQGDGNMNKIFNSMPKAIRVIYGMEGYDLSSSFGYAGLMLFFILVMVAFHGIYLGTGLLGRDQQEKTVDFVFVKPWSRTKVMLHKILSALCIILLLQLVIGLSFYSQLIGLEAMSIFWKMILSSALTHFFFLFLGVCLSILMSQREQAQKIALGLTLLSYLLVVVGQLYELPFIEQASPLGFFPKALVENHFYTGIAITLVLSILFLLLGMKAMKKKQFEA